MKFELTKDEWLNNLEQEFNSQTAEDINFLLNECLFRIRNNEKVSNIIRTIRKSNQISFRQWKALKATLRDYNTKLNNPTKNI